jgi:hypothetical protein
MARFQKSTRKSEKWKYVYLREMDSGDLMWVAQVGNKVSYHKEERQAAIMVDKRRLEQGKNPINILVRK